MKRAFVSPIRCAGLIVLALNGCAGHSNVPAATSQLAQAAGNPLQGFKALQLPRSQLEIGSQWIQDQGPINAGLPDGSRVQVRSLSEVSLTSGRQLTGEMKLGVLRRLGVNLGADGNSLTTSNLRLDSLEVERVSDIAAVQFQANTNYLWEGVKVKRLTVTTRKDRSGALQASIAQNLGSNNVSVSARGADSSTLDVKGLDLFVAYRVVRLQQRAPTQLGRVEWKNRPLNVSASFGGEYDLEVGRGGGPFDAEQLSNGPARGDLCFAYMALTAFNRIQNDYGQPGAPKKYRWEMNCRYSGRAAGQYNRDDGAYTLPTALTDDGLVVDRIILRDAMISRDRNQQFRISAKVEIERRGQEIVPLSSPRAAGW